MGGGVVWLVLCVALASAQYGPDPPNVPSDFLCGWRKLTYEYSLANRPDSGALVHDALQLSKYCTGSESIPRPNESTLPKPFPPRTPPPSVGKTIYADFTKGSDSNPGTMGKPKKTIQAAVNATRGSSPAAVILRKGTFYQTKPVELTQEDSGLTIQNMQGEEVWVSGGIPLTNLKWTPFKTSGHLNVWKTDISNYGLGSIPALRVNGRRMWPARFPNAEPETQFWPIGYLTSNRHDWLAPKISPHPNPAKIVNISTPNRDWDDYFNHYGGGIGGTCSIYDPPFSYWCQSTFSKGCGGCFTWNIPGGLNFQKSLPRHYSNATDALLSAWRVAHWANWQFEIESYHPENSTFIFGKGGFQGARGGPGSDWYISNVLEELDVPGEYYYSKAQGVLYYYSNTTDHTAPPPDTEIVAMQTHTLLRATGQSQKRPIRNITLHGIGFRDTSPTMMEPHGVPSGGDWALERLGSVFFENAEGSRVDTCSWTRIGGNALMLSKYNLRSTILQSDFAWLGGSAIAAWGWTDETTDGGIHGIDGTSGDYPSHTLVQSNLFREIGVWEKQSSAFFQAKTALSTLKQNVVFNLARAGFNFNDGFGGGDVVAENVLFNTCRESSDHGPINSWDRQPFLTTVRTGHPSTQMEWRDVHRNLLIANYGGSKEIDNDDGSLFYKNHDNFMAYGWAQKFKCGGIWSYNNLKAFIDVGGKFDAGCTTHKSAFYPNTWFNDKLIALGDKDFTYRQCWGSDDNGHDWDKTQVRNNTVYMKSEKINAVLTGCHPQKEYTLTEFVKMGNEPGSKQVNGYPTTAEIVAEAKNILGTFGAH